MTRKTAEPAAKHGTQTAPVLPFGTGLSAGHNTGAGRTDPSSIQFKPAPDTPPAAAETASAGDVQAWERVSARLKAKLGVDVYASWFGRARIEEINGPLVTLSVPTNFLRSWIRTHYAAPLLTIWKEERAAVERIDILVRSAARNVTVPVRPAVAEPAPAAATAAPAKVDRTVPRQSAAAIAAQAAAAQAPDPADSVGLDGSPLDPRYTFANLVEGRANEVAVAAARSVAHAGGNAAAPRFNPLFVHAQVGLGKTHLLQAIAWSMKGSMRGSTNGSTTGAANASQAGETAREPKILYLTAEYFMWRFASAIRDHAALSFKESLRDIDLLLIDDMQFLQGKSIQQEFCHLLNALIDSAKQVVVAADRPPAELESLDARVRSRLQGGVAIEIKSPEHGLRRGILDTRLEEARKVDSTLEVSEAVLEHIATQVTGSGRDIEGAFNQILMHHRFGQGELTMDKVDQMLGHLVQSSEPKRVRIEDIQKVVGRHYNVSRNDLLSNRRTQVIVRPRQIAMYLAKTLTPRSLPEIGRRFGGRDHTTVLHAVRKIDRLLGDDRTLGQEIELLKRLIQEV